MNPNSWLTIDCQYLRPRFAASFLQVVEGKALFIENNTSHAIPHLLRALEERHVSVDQVDYLLVTHAHLDHAGATGKLLTLFPNARVLAHPKAVRTLIDPSRLITSARKVYGDKTFETLYGEVLPVSSERIRSLEDGEKWTWQGISFSAVYTEGHASHHLCFYDETSKSIFTGDAFGLSYPDLPVAKPFHIPSTSPIDFDYEKAVKAIEILLRVGANRAYLTHFGTVEDLLERGALLKRHLKFHQGLIDWCDEHAVPDAEVEKIIHHKLQEYFSAELARSGVSQASSPQELLKLDLNLNASGLAFACQKRRKDKR